MNLKVQRLEHLRQAMIEHTERDCRLLQIEDFFRKRQPGTKPDVTGHTRKAAPPGNTGLRLRDAKSQGREVVPQWVALNGLLCDRLRGSRPVEVDAELDVLDGSHKASELWFIQFRWIHHPDPTDIGRNRTGLWGELQLETISIRKKLDRRAQRFGNTNGRHLCSPTHNTPLPRRCSRQRISRAPSNRALIRRQALCRS